MSEQKGSQAAMSRRLFIASTAAVGAMGLIPAHLRAKVQDTGRAVLFPLAQGQFKDNGATPWYARVYVGTPGQQMTVMMDTGTANTWVTSSLCDTPACAAKAYSYDSARSTTYRAVPGAVWQKNALGAWGEFASLAGRDVVRFGTGEQGKLRMKFLSAKLRDAPGSTNWRDLDMCGGVGFPVVFADPQQPDQPESLLPEMLRRGLAARAEVCFWMDGDTGACLVGGRDETRCRKSVENAVFLAPVAEKLNLWAIQLDQFMAGAVPLLGRPVNLALDTGSSRFKGSPVLIRRLAERIRRQKDGSKLPAFFSDPAILRQYPRLTLIINGRRYTLKPRDYIKKIAGRGYSLQFHPLDVGDADTILVGSLLLEHVYTLFEYQQAKGTPYGLRGHKVFLYARP